MGLMTVAEGVNGGSEVEFEVEVGIFIGFRVLCSLQEYSSKYSLALILGS